MAKELLKKAKMEYEWVDAEENKDLTKEEREEIGRLSVEISKIVGKAVRRKIDEEMEREEKRNRDKKS